MQKLLKILRKNARLSAEELAVMTGRTPQEVEAQIAELENKGIIRGYSAVIDDSAFDDDAVLALIELKVTPQSQSGFDEIAARIASYEEVESVRLMSGGYDIMVSVIGRNIRDISQFVTDFIWYLRNILLIQTEDPDEEALGISKENLARMKEEAQDADIRSIMRYIRLLSALTNEMRYAASKRVLLEITVMRMMQPETEENVESLLERVRVLEEKLRNGAAAPASANGAPAASDDAKETAAPQKKQKIVELSPAAYEDYQLLSKNWQNLVEAQSRLFRSVFRGTLVGARENRLQILFRDEYYLNVAVKTGQEARVRKLLSETYGKQFDIELAVLRDNETAPKVVAGSRIPGIEMDIEEE